MDFIRKAVATMLFVVLLIVFFATMIIAYIFATISSNSASIRRKTSYSRYPSRANKKNKEIEYEDVQFIDKKS